MLLDTSNEKCPHCPLYVSRVRMVDHLRLQHRSKAMGPVSIAPKTVLKSRSGLVVTPIIINSTTTVYTKPKVLQGQNPNLRSLLPKLDEMVGCQVCKVRVQGSLMTFHMEQAHRGATFPARTVTTLVPTKVLGDT